MNKIILFKAMRVAAIVGTILLIINQFGALFGSAEIKWLPAILTYCVPFGVFLAGQLSAAKSQALASRE